MVLLQYQGVLLFTTGLNKMACGDSIMDISNITLNIDDISGLHDVIAEVSMEVSTMAPTPAPDASFIPNQQQTLNEVLSTATEISPLPDTPLVPLQTFNELLSQTHTAETQATHTDPMIALKKALGALPNVKEILQMKRASIQSTKYFNPHLFQI
jgi:hypothetical protein